MDNVEATGGAKDTTSGVSQDDRSNDLVSKMKKEKDNWVKANSEKERTISDLQAQIESMQKAELEKQQQYKELAEMESKKRREVEEKMTGLEKLMRQEKVDSKLRNELLTQGLRSDLVEEALRIVDRSSIAFHPETNSVLGVDDAAKAFKEKYKDIFFGQKIPGVSYNAAGVTPKAEKSLSEMGFQEKLEALSKLNK